MDLYDKTKSDDAYFGSIFCLIFIFSVIFIIIIYFLKVLNKCCKYKNQVFI